MTFQFELPPEELAAALKRLLSQSHDGLRLKESAGQRVKFLYPPRRIVARGHLERSVDGGGTQLLVSVPLPIHRLLIHAPLGLMIAAVGWWRPENPLGTTPIAVGLVIFAVSMASGVFAFRRGRERLKTLLCHHSLKPEGAVHALGLEA